jgi:hypothetical protein
MMIKASSPFKLTFNELGFYVGFDWQVFEKPAERSAFESEARKQGLKFRIFKPGSVAYGAAWSDDLGKTPLLVERLQANYGRANLLVCEELSNGRFYVLLIHHGIVKFDKVFTVNTLKTVAAQYLKNNDSFEVFSSQELPFLGEKVQPLTALKLKRPFKASKKHIGPVILLSALAIGFPTYHLYDGWNQEQQALEQKRRAEMQKQATILANQAGYVNSFNYKALMQPVGHSDLKALITAPKNIDGWIYNGFSCQAESSGLRCVVEYKVDSQAKYTPYPRALEYSVLGQQCKFGGFNPTLKSISCSLLMAKTEKLQPLSKESVKAFDAINLIVDRYGLTSEFTMQAQPRPYPEDWQYVAVQFSTKSVDEIYKPYLPDFSVERFTHDAEKNIYEIRGKYATH